MVFFFGLGLAFFALSINNTYASNTLIILSTTPVVSAILSYIVLKEKTHLITWICSLIVCIGIIIIFYNHITPKHIIGNLFAVGAVFTLCINSVIARKYDKISVLPGIFIGGTLAAIIFSFFADWSTVTQKTIIITFINGSLVIALSFALINYAYKILPPVEANLFFLLEVIFGSLWVWLIVNEVPSKSTFIAMTLILPVLLFHGIWSIKKDIKLQKT